MMSNIIGSGLEIYIKRNARDKALNQVVEAESRAASILSEAEQRIQIMRRDTQANTRLRLAQNRRRLLAQAELRAKQVMMMRRQEVMQQLWEQVAQTVRGISSPEQRLTLLERGLVDAARQLGGGALEFQVNAEDHALLNKEKLALWQHQLAHEGVKDLVLAEDAAPIWGGVVVRRPETHQVVDNSWNERLALAQRTLRDQVYHWLTPSDPAASEQG